MENISFLQRKSPPPDQDEGAMPEILCKTTLPDAAQEVNYIGRIEERKAFYNKLEQNDVPQSRPLAIDLSEYCGTFYVENYPPPFDWLLTNSLRRIGLAAMLGAGGAGKSTAALQLCAAVACALPWLDTWQTEKPEKAIYISAEDDKTTLHRRAHHILKSLPDYAQRQAAENLHALPVHGKVALCEGTAGNISKTDNLDDLKSIIEFNRPALVVLDTLARFFAVTENDNTALTTACGYLEELCHQYQCAILILHHNNKTNSSLAKDNSTLYMALDATAARGGTALTGCVRWQMQLAPLSANFANNIIGDAAKGKPDGHFVAIRVAKKNAGTPEKQYFLERLEHGILRRIEPAKHEQEAANTEEDASQLIKEVLRRAKEGLDPLTQSRGGRDVFSWGGERSKKAVFAALESGKIVKIKKPKGNGEILVPPQKVADGALPTPALPALPEVAGEVDLSND